MSLLDEEFHWFLCGSEAGMCCFGPYQDYNHCKRDADEPACDHDHMVMAMTPRQLVATLPSSAWYWMCAFWAPAADGRDEVMIVRGWSDLDAQEKVDLYDEMADLLDTRNSSRSASIAS